MAARFNRKERLRSSDLGCASMTSNHELSCSYAGRSGTLQLEATSEPATPRWQPLCCLSNPHCVISKDLDL